MPHMSPMYWTYMLFSSWATLTLISANFYFYKSKQMMINENNQTSANMTWKWYSS